MCNAHPRFLLLLNRQTYSGLNLNQDKAASRRQYTHYGKQAVARTPVNRVRG